MADIDKVDVAAVVMERDAYAFENAMLRSALDKAHAELYAAACERPQPVELSYQVLVVPGRVDERLERAVGALGGVTVAIITEDLPPGLVERREPEVRQTEFRSANADGDASLLIAKAWFPQAVLEHRKVVSR